MRITYLLIILFSSIGYTQVTQFPQVYYNGQGSGGSNLNVRELPSLSSPILTSISTVSQIGAVSDTTSVETNGVTLWVKVTLPSGDGNIKYGYMLDGQFYARIKEMNTYAKVTASSLDIRQCAGCTNSSVTINGQPALFGLNSIVALTGNSSNGWSEVYLTNDCSQNKGWISSASISINSSPNNYFISSGTVKNSDNQLIWGAVIDFGGFITISTEGFYQIKLPPNYSNIITCGIPEGSFFTYNITSPEIIPYTINSHQYENNFSLSNNNPCGVNSILFETQSQIDEFPQNYPECVSPYGINIKSNPPESINNLDSLIQLKYIREWLFIENNNMLLTLKGLDSIKTVGALNIYENNKLQNLDQLSKLLKSGISVINNISLKNINGLSNIKSTNQPLFISGNDRIKNIEAISNLEYFNERAFNNHQFWNTNYVIWINHNDSLESLHGLHNIKNMNSSIEEIRFEYNNLLTTCNIESICDYLDLQKPAFIQNNSIGCNTNEEVLNLCNNGGCSQINITSEPQNILILESGIGQITLNTTGSDISFQWQISTDNGISWSNISNSGNYSGTNTNALTISNAQLSMNGYKFRCSLMNSCTPEIFTQTATLTVTSNCIPISSNYTIEDRTVIEPTPANFGLTISGTDITYIWEYSTNNGNTWITVPNSSPYVGTGTSSLTIVPTSLTLNGYKYRCKVYNDCTAEAYTNWATLTVSSSCLPVNISAQPQDLSVTQGQQGLFLVQAEGTQPINVQWYKNNQPIQGATNFQYQIPPALLSDNGSIYKAVLNNCSGNSTIESNSAILNVSASCNEVSVISGPLSTSVPEGGTASFQINVEGDEPILYQWYFNNQGISAPNSNTYTISNVNQSNSGFYYCEVRNCLVNGIYNGVDGSQVATLTVTQGCSQVGIQTQPIDKPGVVGGTVTFSVTPSGTGPYTYQWKKNGANIQTGGNSNEYTTPVLSLSDNGNKYSCYLTNCQGQYNKTSNEATLTVTQNCNAPTLQGSNIVASNITNNQMTLTWTVGNGNKRIIVAKKNGNVNANPVNGINYNGNSVFGSGSTIAANEYVVYNGPGNTVTVTNLEANIGYYFKVFEYDCTPTKYLTSNASGSEKLFSTNANTPNITQFVGTCKVPTHGTEYTFYNWPSTNQSTPLKVCADGSRATYFKVKIDDYNGVHFKIKYNNDYVWTPINTTDVSRYGQLLNINQFTTSLGKFVEINYEHPDHVSDGLYLPLKLEVTHNNNTIASFDLHIYRAPILFVHGFMGSSDAFYEMETNLLASNFYPKGLNSPLTYKVDYHQTSFQRFHNNRWVVPYGIDQVFNKVKKDNFSSGKAIIIAHSMGGILSRLYLQNKVIIDIYKYRDDIQKLITLNTPHYGTQFADWGIKNWGLLIKIVEFNIQNFNTPIDDGAIKDLRVGSEAIINKLNIAKSLQNKVPSIVLGSSKTAGPYNTATEKGINLFVYNLNKLYNYENHDMIVPMKSQKSTLDNIIDANFQFHIGSSSNLTMINKIKNYIIFDPDNPAFYKDGFPKGSVTYSYDFKETNKNQLNRSLSNTIKILNPSHGSKYNSLDTLNIELDVTGSYFRKSLIIYGQSFGPFIIDSIVTNNIIFIIPDSAIGELKILALGGDSTEWKSTDEVSIFIQNSASFDSLIIEPDTLLLPLGTSNFLNPKGFFDGKSKPISILNFPNLNIEYDTSILNLTQNLFYGKALGNTYVKFTYQGLSDSVYVEVTNDTTALLASFNYTTETTCSNSTIQFQDQSRGLATSYEWTFIGGVPGTSTEKNPLIHYSSPGKYPVKLKTTFINGVDSFQIDSLITVLPNPTVSITNDGLLEFCQDNSVALNAVSEGNVIEWSTFDTTQAITVYESGDYFAIVTDSNRCTAISDTLSVVVYDLPDATITASNALAFCNGDSIALTIPESNLYLWNTGDTSQLIIAKTAGDYFVSVTDTFGCNALSDTLHIIVHDLPEGIITATNPTSFCLGDSITLTSNFANDYFWSSEDTTQQIIVKTDGDYFVIVTDTFGCSSISDTLQIVVYQLPEVAIIPNGPTTFCHGDSIILSSNLSESYLWNTNDTTQSINVTLSGDYSLLVTDSNGCSSVSLPVNIIINDLPTPIISSNEPTNFCEGDSITLNTIDAVSYWWSRGDTTQNILVNSSGEFFVSVIDSNGCQGISDTLIVIESENPIANISTSRSAILCQGDSVTLTADNAETYLWSNGATTKSITVNYANDFKVTVTNSMGCVSVSNVINVKVNPLPLVSISHDNDTQLCRGDTLFLTSSEGTAYNWNTGDTTKNINVEESGEYLVEVTDINGCKNISTPINIVVYELPISTINYQGDTIFCDGDSITLLSNPASSYNWNNNTSTQANTIYNSGKYFVKITDINGCSSVSDSIEIIVNQLPEANITSSKGSSICDGDTTLLSVNEALSYYWSTGDTSRKITTVDSGSYTVKVMDGNGCSNVSEPFSLKVNTLPSAIITSSGSTTFCEGTSTTLMASEGNSFQWSNGETTQEITVDSTGDFKVTVTDANGCSNTSNTIIATALPLLTPIVEITSSANSICEGDSITFTAIATNGGLTPTYQWTINGQIQSENSPSFTTSNIINGNSANCMMTSSELCLTTPKDVSNSIAVAVNAKVTPLVSITGSSPEIFACDDITFVAQGVNTGFTPEYKWYANGNLVWVGSNFETNGFISNTTIHCELHSSAICLIANDVSSDTLSITVLPLPQPLLELNVDTLSIKNYFANDYTYTWYKDGVIISNDVYIVCSDEGIGSYYVVVKKGDCSTTSSTLDVFECTTLAEDIAAFDVNIYPNPTTGRLNVIVPSQNSTTVTLTFYNSIGNVISTKRLDSSSEVDISELSNSLYLLKIEENNKYSFVKILKME